MSQNSIRAGPVLLLGSTLPAQSLGYRSDTLTTEMGHKRQRNEQRIWLLLVLQLRFFREDCTVGRRGNLALKGTDKVTHVDRLKRKRSVASPETWVSEDPRFQPCPKERQFGCPLDAWRPPSIGRFTPTNPHSGEMLNARTWSTGSRGLRELFPGGRHPPPGRDRPLREQRRRSILRPWRQDVRPIVVGPGWWA